MIVVHRVLVVVFVAIDAGEHAVFRSVVVAIGTSVPFPVVVAAVNGEELAIMIERRVAPCGLIMAHGTVRAESRCRVVGIGRAVVLRHVACAACRRGSRVSVRMALDACRGDVATMQREIRDVMVE